MESLNTKHQAVIQALASLEESLKDLQEPAAQRFYRAIRDSVIKRFEYSMDSLWKLLKLYLATQYTVDSVPSPKSVLRQCFTMNIITENELQRFLDIIEDRNLTSHLYREEMAVLVASRIPEYLQLMKSIVERLKIPQ